MARPKKIKEDEVAAESFTSVVKVSNIDVITHEFANGELNILRDKINEIIRQG